jgi:multidrug efflux pump subunit AcrB
MAGHSVGRCETAKIRFPVVARLRMEERSQLADIRSLYVYASQGQQKVPLQSISSVVYGMRTERLQRRNQFRTITVSAFPMPGISRRRSSSGDAEAEGVRAALASGLQDGDRWRARGAGQGLQEPGDRDAHLDRDDLRGPGFQFKHSIKPMIVFAAIPYGVMGSLAALYAMGAPFGFMAFLGVASLIGVIVSHIIVLFDFIEERHEAGEPLIEALLDAGIMRLRPVLITVAATVIALFPLAAHGGPLWEPLCYAQIGGLTIATFVTLLLVPVLYATFVLDLKLVKWGEPERRRTRRDSRTSRPAEAV